MKNELKNILDDVWNCVEAGNCSKAKALLTAAKGCIDVIENVDVDELYIAYLRTFIEALKNGKEL